MGRFAARRLDIEDLVLIAAPVARDGRGSFTETYNAREFAELGIGAVFVQDNQSLSTRAGTVRGLHFQLPPHAQAKLVRVVKGAVYDVAVDIRQGSPSYGRWSAVTLTAVGAEQLFIPKGFAHGFCTLEPETEVAYKVDAHYAPAHDAGVLWDDPDLGIPWPVAEGEAVLAERDRKLPRLSDFASPFRYGDG
jgi:dTDP-4-dehydrorhamnose 3,5-epimerase